MHELPTLSLAELYSNRDQFIYSLSRVAREVGFFIYQILVLIMKKSIIFII